MTRRPLHILLLAGLLAAACDRGAPEEEMRGHEAPAAAPLDEGLAAALPEGVSMEQAREGAGHFSRTCAVCHGPAGGGTQLAPPLVGAEWRRVEPRLGPLSELIRSGIPEAREYPVPMPVRGGGEFTDEQIQAVAAYTLALHRSAPAQPRPGEGSAAQ